MNITDEAVEAAAKALLRIERPSHPTWEEWAKDGQDSWRYEARVILEAAAEHLFKNMRRLSLYEIAMRDNPERMKAARLKMQEEARHVRREESERISEHFRKAQEAAWLAGVEASAEAIWEHEKLAPNPYCPVLKLEQKRAAWLNPSAFPETRYAKPGGDKP